jgi:hypothetical protein
MFAWEVFTFTRFSADTQLLSYPWEPDGGAANIQLMRKSGLCASINSHASLQWRTRF